MMKLCKVLERIGKGRGEIVCRSDDVRGKRS